MQFCINCGAELGDGDRYCTSCGTPAYDLDLKSDVGLPTAEIDLGASAVETSPEDSSAQTAVAVQDVAASESAAPTDSDDLQMAQEQLLADTQALEEERAAIERERAELERRKAEQEARRREHERLEQERLERQRQEEVKRERERLEQERVRLAEERRKVDEQREELERLRRQVEDEDRLLQMEEARLAQEEIDNGADAEAAGEETVEKPAEAELAGAAEAEDDIAVASVAEPALPEEPAEPDDDSDATVILSQLEGFDAGSSQDADDSETTILVDDAAFSSSAGSEGDDETTILAPSARSYLMHVGTGERLYFVVPAIIGKGSAADVRIPDNTNISREHARIECEGTEYYIVDLGSTNGTEVDGERLSEGKRRPLREGALVQLADELFAFGIESD